MFTNKFIHKIARMSSNSLSQADTIPWKTVTLGVTMTGFMGSALAFFSDRAHKENNMTRRELKEEMHAMENRLNKNIADSETRINTTLEEIKSEIRTIKL